MAKICDRTIELLEGTKTFTQGDDILDYVPDADDVSDSGFESYIVHVYEIGIITGTSNGSFMPFKTLSRAEAATVIHRVIDEDERVAFENPYPSELVINYYDEDAHPDFVLDIRFDEPVEPQFEDAIKYLTPLAGEALALEMVNYAKSKTKIDDLVTSKIWYTEDMTFEIYSTWGSMATTIRGWEVN
jgi:hypothetical protein